jgi:ribosome assembly protein 4
MEQIKVRNKFKPKDNYEINRAKVKREMFQGKEKREEILKSTRNKTGNLKTNNLQTQPTIPSQLVTKFISMEGIELNQKDTLTNEITLPTEITASDLNKLMNEQLLKNEEEKQSYQFFINDIQIKTTLKDTLQKIKDFSSETTYQIVYCPESLFRVKPLTRGGSVLEGHSDSILTVRFSPCSTLLCSGGGDQIVRFWDMFTDTALDIQKNVHHSWILCLEFSPCSSFLASGDLEGYFCVWNTKTMFPLQRKAIKAHSKWITSISWKPLHLYTQNNEERFVTSGKDGYLKMWDMRTMKCLINVHAHDQAITKTIWSGENNIYTSSQDQTIKIFDSNFNHINTLLGHAHWINTMAINTEQLLRTGCFDYDKCKNDAHFEYTQTLKEKPFLEKVELAKKRYTAFKEKINSSEKILTGSDDFTLILWDANKSTKPLMRMTGHQGIVNDVKFSPNAFYLASASFDKCIKIWNANNGNFLFNLRGHVGPVYQISWAPNSKMLLSRSKDSTLQCWNIETKKMMHNLPGHADEIYTVDWSPNGEKAASGSKDQRIRIWVN